jgi:uncharacterized lipoprotein YmbA
MIRPSVRSTLLACGLSLVLPACIGSSRPARFYTLAPLAVPDGRAAGDADATLAVGPVEIPEYVDRNQIVTRAGEHGVAMAEFDRWAGPLEREITRCLVATLADRLGPAHVAPWRSVAVGPGAPAHRVVVSISRFDGTLGQSIVLQGRWALVAERGGQGPLVAREATITEKIDGAGYDALVAAMQRALVRFGREMADAIVTSTRVASAPRPLVPRRE